MSRINLIAALARNRVIGNRQQIPWRIPGEQAYFKKVTLGHPIVMGRKTWESIGRPLPGRRNIVVTRSPNYVAADADVVDSLDAALALVPNSADVFVIGGGELFAQALPSADRLFLTEIDADFEGDAFFPQFDRAGWREMSRMTNAAEGGRPFAYSFVVYERLK
jgi:dihydrofolate reductase